MEQAVIVSTARSPIGRAFKGSLISVRPDDLCADMIRAALRKVPSLDPAQVEDVMIGCGQPAGESGYNVARVSALLAGLNAPGVTVNRYCSSSLQTIRMAAHAIRAGEGHCFIAGGVETVSRFVNGRADGMDNTRNPRFADAQARSAERATGGAESWAPSEGLPDIYIAMGQTAENAAQATGTTREDMDEYAALSQARAAAAIERGFYTEEIEPVTLADGTVVDKDDCPRPTTTVEGLAKLKPVFRPDGLVTAGNACPLNDGAAAVIVMSESRAKELGLTPLARIVSSGVSALNPEIMGLGPVQASLQAMGRAGLTIDDIDLVELNEAFAAQVVPSARELSLSYDKLNVNGGAIAIGHPFGMTGSRIMTTLIHGLQDADKTFGLETMCVGGGQGMAMIVERLS